MNRPLSDHPWVDRRRARTQYGCAVFGDTGNVLLSGKISRKFPAISATNEHVMGRAIDEQVGGDHYKNLSIQPITYIFANRLGFAEGNVVKYVTRYAMKGGVEDLEKARHYLDLLIENVKAHA